VPSSDPVQRFEDILENIARIEGFTAGMDLEAFTQNTQALYAVKYALLTISEAAPPQYSPRVTAAMADMVLITKPINSANSVSARVFSGAHCSGKEPRS